MHPGPPLTVQEESHVLRAPEQAVHVPVGAGRVRDALLVLAAAVVSRLGASVVHVGIKRVLHVDVLLAVVEEMREERDDTMMGGGSGEKEL